MCGIAGILNMDVQRDALRADVATMLTRLAHRGPDDHGLWDEDGVALGQRRLSIIDLSVAGHQPMTSHCGRYVLVYNGEIYNHLDLRREAAVDIPFAGSSDTESLLACIARRGLKPTLELVRGMFALALWDRKTRTLSLARDRAGEKPLYYWRDGRQLYFFSEISAFLTVAPQRLRLTKADLIHYLSYGYMGRGEDALCGIRQVMPGGVVEIGSNASVGSSLFWSLPSAGRGQIADRASAVDRIDDLLGSAVSEQMMSDVPLGAFLSGGIDSSLIVAQMRKHSKVKTFTISFSDSALDESKHAAAVAKHLGTDHHCTQLDERTALEIAAEMPRLLDQPFGDASFIPTYLLSRITKRHVTVALSGDGGDELFGGYPRYTIGEKLRRYSFLKMGLIPGALIATRWPRTARLLLGLGARGASDIAEVLALQSAAIHGLAEVPGKGDALDGGDGHYGVFGTRFDFSTYLPNDILVKVDRAAMANSLETRAPFLDERVIRFAFGLDWSLRGGAEARKVVLRELLSRYLPRDLYERPKQGFSVPIGKWLATELKEWANPLFQHELNRLDGLSPKFTRGVQRLWLLHKNGNYGFTQLLWSIAVLLDWMKRHEIVLADA